MRILIISQYYWPETFRINDLAKSLVGEGYEITVLTGLPNYPSGKLFSGYHFWSIGKDMHDEVPVYRVPLIPRFSGKSINLVFNYISFVFFSCLLGPFLCNKKYDLIFVYEPSPFTVGIPGVFFRFIKKAPMIFWVQDLWPESITAAGAIKSKLIIDMVSKMVRWIYNRTDLVLIQSEAFKEPAIHSGANPDKIIYFPNWAEEIYRPMNADKSSLEVMPDGFIVMFAGNLGEAQSLPTITAAANRLKDYDNIHWVIIGDGRKMQWMVDEVSRLNLEKNVHFLGRKPVDEMPGYLAVADALLVTLKDESAFEHTIPSKVQSYMACGKPILASINGEAARVINEAEAGIAVAAEDDEALSSSVLELYKSSSEARSNMGKSAHQYYLDNFDKNRLINKLETIFTELAGKP